MAYFNVLVLFLLLIISAGCNNPKGGSVISRGHTPLLEPPGIFGWTQIRSANGIADIDWQSSPRAANYEFFIGTSSADVTTPVPACSTVASACRLTGLDPDTVYYFNIKAVNAAGSKFVSSIQSALSVGSFDIGTVSPSDGTITLNWGTSNNATSYNVVYGTVSGVYRNRVSNVTSPYTISGLTNGVRYYVRVEAVNTNNGFALNTTEKFSQPYGPLGPPTGLVATASPANVILDWNDLPGAYSYKVYRGPNASSLVEIANGVTSSTFVDTHNTDGTTFFYAVRGFNDFDSAWSATVSAQSISAFNATSATAPAPSQIRVIWPAPVTGATAYDIRYGTNPASLNQIVTNVTSPYTISALTGGVPYYFKVIARNAIGTGATQPSTNQLTATTVSPLPAPTGLTASTAPATVTLNWTAVPGATNYNIYRGTTAGSRTFLGNTASTNFVNNGVTNGQPYYYTVRADNGFESVDSSEVAVKTLSTFTLSSANVYSFREVDLTWLPSTGGDAYDIVYGTSSGSYQNTSANRTSGSRLAGLTASTTYYVAIRARNSVGAGSNIISNELTFTTTSQYPTVSITTYPLINNANKASYTLSGACSENGRTVNVSVGGVTATPACTGLAWTATLNVTAAADSSALAITASHTNTGGNSANASRTVVKDTTNPTVAINNYPAINNTNKASYTVSGSCSENTRSVAVSVGGILSSPVCTTLNWSATVDVSGLGDSNTIAITADLTDAAGNTATQATRTVVKDTVIPSVAISSSPVINNANKASYTVSGTCSETGENVVVKVGATTSTVVCSLLTWTTTMNVSANADSAVLLVTADHTDDSGNAAPQASTLVVKDTANPTIAITVYPTIINANKASYTVSGTCSENTQTVSVSVGGLTASTTCSSSAWTATLDVTSLADGPSIPITADHVDAAGNSATQAMRSVLKNTALPTVAILSYPAINNTNKAAYPISGSCSENARPITLNIGGVTASPNCSGTTWSAAVNVSALADNATITITADHSDTVGNNANQASVTTFKDIVIPTVSISSAPSINNNNKASYTVSGACSENGRTVSVSVGAVTGTPTCSSLAWTTTLNVTSVADGGSVSVTANHTDLAGNNAVQALTSVLKDTTNPTVTLGTLASINNSNKSSYPVSGTCSENGRNISVNVGGISGTTTCTSLAWSTNLDVSGVTDNNNIAVTADHSDLAGNAATQASTTVVKDTSLPTVAIDAPAVINNSNKNSYTVTGTCSETGRAVSVSVGATTGSVTCTLLTWSATLNVSANADSLTLMIRADHTDAAGNTAVQAATTVVKDTLNPTVAITFYPSIDNSNKSAYTVSGSCSENGRNVSVSVGGVTATPGCSSLAWTATLDVSGISDSASVSITANHTDSAGNTATPASRTVIKDTSVPTVAINAPAVINNANKASYTVSGSCSENGRSVAVNVGGVTASPVCTTLAWTTTLNVTAVGDNASVSITANHDDVVGNDAVEASASVLKDTINPTVAITSSPLINNSNKAAYTVSGTCSENGRTVTVSVGGVVPGTQPTCSSSTWSATLNVTGIADGSAISVIANHSDAAGNSATQATTTVIKDTNVPTVAITAPAIINNSNKASYTISGSCSENARAVTVNIGGVTSSPNCATLAWTTTVDVTLVADGAAVSITADHSDSSGNVAVQATTTILKDTVNPTVAISAPVVINNANKANYSLSGTCSENGRTVSVTVGSVSSSPACSAGTWSITGLNVTAVADNASVSITANHSDAAGNTATEASATVLKDTINPTVAITSSPAINNSNKAAYTISGSCSENTRTVSVSVGGVTASPACTSSAWTATLNVTGVTDDTAVPVTANHSDAAGNNAPQASTTVVKNTGFPSVAITSSPAINNTNKSAYTVSGTCSEYTRTVSVNVGGVTASPVCNTGNWTTTLNVSGLSDSGTVGITADHSDSVGNAAEQATTTVIKDTVIPTIAISSSPVINNANKSSYTVTGSCSENGRAVNVSVGAASGSASCTTLAWTVTIDVSSVADNAAVSVTANHSDVAGNNANQASASVLKDTVNPTVAISSSAAINDGNKTSYPVNGTCSENGRTVSVNVGGVTGSATCTSLAWSITLNVSAVADGALISATANHTDLAGNNAPQANTTLVKDTGVPTVAITSSPSINNTNKGSYTVAGTCSENGRIVTVSVGGVSPGVQPTCTSSAWTTTFSVTSVSDSASVAINVSHNDASGNAITANTTVLKDIVIPTVTVTSNTAINNTNKASYPVSGSCSENTRTVTVFVGGVSGSATCTSLAWTTNLDVSSVGDGASISITADHTDLAGNNAIQATASVQKDTTIPTVAITAPVAINNTNKASYPVNGSCSENGRTVTVLVGGVAPATQPTCTALAWSTSVNVTAVGDNAAVSITANHSDASGNNAGEASASVLKDTVIPTVSIAAANAINNTNKSSYTLNGSCSENGNTVTVNVGGVVDSPVCTSLAWTSTLNVSTVTDSGSVSITAAHSDVAGNNAVTASTTVSKDTAIPTVAIGATSYINNINEASYTVTGSCSENGRTVLVMVGGIAPATQPTCTTLAWSATVNATSLSDGSVTITADHTDAAGNFAVQATATATKDTTAPSVAITSPGAINSGNRLAYTVGGSCSENGRNVSVNVGGVSGTAVCSGNSWSTNLNVNGVADNASVSITADHTDAASNSAVQAVASALKDTVIPIVAIGSLSTINNTNKASYTVSGTCSENARTVSVSVGGVAGTPVCSGNVWTTTLSVTSVADGTVTVTANHTDLAGNSAVQASTTVSKDTSNPTVAISTPSAINNTNKASYSVSGACSENGQAVSVNVGGVAASPNCMTLAWTTTVDVSGVADGAAISITANHSDVAGNAATQASTTVLKDTVLPTVAIVSAPPINNSNKSSYTLSGSCSENTRTVSVNVGGVTGSPVCTSLAWTTTLNVSGVADSASVSVTANHNDLAGNAATTASTTISKDSSIPTVAINSPAVINNNNKTSYTVTGSCSETGRIVSVSVGSVNTTDTCTLLTWTVTVDVSGNPDSTTLLITADHTDDAGNTAVQSGVTVLKDTVNPTVTIAAMSTINNANKAAYTVNGTCSENGRSVSVSVGGVSGSGTCSGGSWTTGALNVTAAADSATLSITADHTDSAGNNATQATRTVIKDTSNPTVAITSAPNINNANKASYTVSGTCSEETRTVSVNIGGLTSSPACSSGSWTTGALNVTAATDSGTFSVTADHTDANGNNATTATSTIIKDTVNPTVALSTTEPASTSSTAWTIRATFSEPVTGVTLSDFVVTNGTTASFTTVSSSVFEMILTPTAAGSVTINMAASAAADVVGNASSAATQISRTFVTPASLNYAIATTHNFGTLSVGGTADVAMLVQKTGTMNATAITEISLAAPFAFKGGAFPGTGGTCTTTISGDCSIVVTYSPTAAGTHNGFVQLRYNDGSVFQTVSRALTGTAGNFTPTKIDVAGATGVVAGQCVPYTITAMTNDNVAANVAAAQTINLIANNVTSGTALFYTTNTCATTTTTASIAAAANSTTVYFKASAAGQAISLVFNPTSLTGTSLTVNTSTAPTAIAVTTPLEMETNSCNAIDINLVDASGNKTGKTTAVQVNLTKTGSAVFYSDTVCTGVITNVTFPINTTTKTVYVKDTVQESSTLTFTDNAAVLTQKINTVSFVNSLTWWNTAYMKRKPIIISNQDQATAFTDMPVLIRLNTSRINYADILAGGADIRFTLDDHSTALSYEIEKWNSTGESLIWVKVPSLAASSSKVIYMYYNNSSATDGQSAAGTWSGYSGVWNMKKTGANYVDSTGSGKTGVPEGTVTDVTGPSGTAVSFDGASAINVGYDLSQVLGTNMTLTAWVKTTDAGHPQDWSAPAITGVRDDATNNEIFIGWLDNTGKIAVTARNAPGNATANFVVNDGAWRHVTISRVSTGAVKFYVNGVLNGSGNSGNGAVTMPFYRFGRVDHAAGTPKFFIGSMDGLRMSNSVQTDARVKAEFKYSVEGNVSYGSEENL